MRPLGFALMTALVWVSTLTLSAHTVAAVNAAAVIKHSQAAKGFINLFYDNSSGTLYLEPHKLNQPFILLTSLPHGVGSNDIGLDRGQLGYTRLVQFERLGPYLILKQLNTQYRANSDNLAEQRAVKEAFAESVLWRGTVIEGKRTLVAINDLVVKDLHGITLSLKQSEQGQYRLDKSRSLILPEGVKSFKSNSDVDVLLTFISDKAGKFVAQVTPDPLHMSVRLRYSFIALPEAGYTPRAYHPMSGYLSDDYLDYGARVDEDIRARFLLRHRLQKITQGAAPSKVIKPIIYYLDPGVPEPIRSALLDGARWWSEAFTEAGFIDGFQVKLLPDDADPQDVRYNVIQWVHRATRGWSYGAAVTDPRTGEIIKGHVTLGSQRVRQDQLIARGLTAGWKDRDAAQKANMALALARIRQLAAHEVGHTLGLDHNFAASSNNNASVMDYPYPNINFDGEHIDISAPYSVGIGAWDKYTIAYGYSELGDNEAEKLTQMRRQVASQGLRYIGEADSRSKAASHAYASLWDNGDDPVAELKRLSAIRAQAIESFSDQALLQDQPLGELSDAFVPIYYLTRFQISAAAKMIGGSDYGYYDGDERWSFIAPELQQQALAQLLTTLAPQALSISPDLQSTLIPKSGNYRYNRESFHSALGVVIDPVAMAEGLSRHTIATILAPTRLNRVEQGYLNDDEQLSVTQLVDALLDRTLYSDAPKRSQMGVWMRVNNVTLDELLNAYHNENTRPEVKAQLKERLDYALKQIKRKVKRVSAYESAHYMMLQKGIEKGLEDPQWRLIAKPLPMPPGSPI